MVVEELIAILQKQDPRGRVYIQAPSGALYLPGDVERPLTKDVGEFWPVIICAGEYQGEQEDLAQ